MKPRDWSDVGAINLSGATTRDAFAAWEREIAQALIGFGINPKHAASAATAILSELEGALLLARIQRSLDPMRCAEKASRMLVRAERGRWR